MEINGTGREASGEENSPNGVNGHHGMNGLDGSNGVNGNHGANGLDGPNGVNGAHQQATSPQKSVQDPIAVVGLACRLPDKCHTTHAFWKFIEGGGIAQNRPPASRFNVDTHVSNRHMGKETFGDGFEMLTPVTPACSMTGRSRTRPWPLRAVCSCKALTSATSTHNSSSCLASKRWPWIPSNGSCSRSSMKALKTLVLPWSSYTIRPSAASLGPLPATMVTCRPEIQRIARRQQQLGLVALC